MNMLSVLIDDLNRELLYQAGEVQLPVTANQKFLTLESDGDDHKVFLLGILVYSTRLQEAMENIPLNVDVELNERQNFEPYLRTVINDQLHVIRQLQL
jgi:hypothetical protein